MMKKLYSVAAALALLWCAASVAQAQDWDRAISLFNQKQYRQAIREFHAVLRANPDYYQAWYYIGAGHFQLQGYEDAADALQKYVTAAQKDEKGQAGGYLYIGLAHYQLKQYDKAIPALARHITLSEKLQQKPDISARAALGRAYVFTERFNEAIPVLTAAASETKTDSNNHYFLGYSYQKTGRIDQAIAALNQGLAINPKDADSLLLLGNIYLGQLKQNPVAIKQAISTGERLAAVRDDESAWSLLGQAYLFDKQYAKAAPLLDKYARAHQDSSAAWLNLGLAYSRSSQWKPAAEALEQATKLDTKNTAALLELGYVYESDKQYDKALTAYERAYEASGRRDEFARTSIERVKQAKP
ncbi:MAG TPA: tetratricopeptide repeat protein [Blastocatellia bacterium]|nr:tetratricopeptide repeat protein [Blastocatellia bacterium]